MRRICYDGECITVWIENENDEGFDLVLKSEKREERFRVRFEDFPFLRKVNDLHKFSISLCGIWWDEVDEGIEFDSLRYPERYPLPLRK